MSAVELAAIARPAARSRGRLPDLIDWDLLASFGYDDATRIINPPDDHRVFGRTRCVVAGCDYIRWTPRGDLMCGGCRWARKRAKDDEASAADLLARRRPASGNALCLVCRTPGHERPAGGASPLCRSCNALRALRRQTVDAYVAGDDRYPAAEPRETYGVCRAARCRRWAAFRTDLCASHHAAFPRSGRTFAEFCAAATNPDRGLDASIDLAPLPDTLRMELLASLCIEGRAGRAQLAVLFRRLVRLLVRRRVTSLLATDEPPGNDADVQVWRSLRRNLRRAVATPDDEARRDDWDLQVFGYANGRLSFRSLAQPWLREGAKQWVLGHLARGMSVTSLGAEVAALRLLSETLGNRDDQGSQFTQLGRSDVEAHLARLNRLERRGDISNATHWRAMLYARRFLRDAAASGLSDAGGPMVGMPPSFGFRLGDRVQVTTTSDDDLAGKALPDEVLEQLLAESALAVLRRLSGEQMVAWVRLQAEIGRRPDEVCALPLDCLDHDRFVDELGHADRRPVLVFDMPKVLGRRHRLPIHTTTAGIIEAQQQRVLTRFPQTPRKQLPLFPRTSMNPNGRERVSSSTVGAFILSWMKALEELSYRDERGQVIAFPRSRVNAYAFRHTYAQRHTDAGTPVEVLQQLLGHEKISSTQGYYRVTAARRRDAVNKIVPLQVDARGVRTRPGLDRVLDSEVLREDVGSLSIPYGQCVEPSNVRSHGRSCAFRYQCFGCTHFRTDPSYLPELREHLARRLSDIEVLAATDAVTDWAVDAARPRDEELEAVRNLIRVCEAELDELGSTDRALVKHAIARMRQARGDLDEVMPFGQRQRVRQVAPVLFPAAIPVRRAAPSTESCDVVG